MHWRIGEVLIQKRLINWDQLQEVLDEQRRTQGLTGEILVRKRYISKTLLFGALAKQYDIPYVDPERIHINPKATESVPQSIAQKYSILPLELRDDALFVGMSDPRNGWPEDELKQLTGVKEIKTVLCLPETVQRFLQESYEQSA